MLTCPHHLRSQPTYEELKLTIAGIAAAVGPGSQPTYEELKLGSTDPARALYKCSQPTYEELKQLIPAGDVKICPVPSLPMRN